MSTFLASKKVVQVVPIGGRGGWGNLDKIQKNSSFFFRETVLNSVSEAYLWVMYFLSLN